MTNTQQRAELQRQIWQIANDVRDAVDGWDFKQYVLGALFYRFISENFAGYMEADDESIDYAELPDKADFAFVLHALSYLSSKGRAAIVCFPGIFYRGGAERKIRKYLVDNNHVETVIALAPNLFYGTSIAVNILVLASLDKDAHTVQFDRYHQQIKDAINDVLSD